MKVMTFHFYITITMTYGVCVVMLVYRVCYYFLFFVATLSFNNPAIVVVRVTSSNQKAGALLNYILFLFLMHRTMYFA